MMDTEIFQAWANKGHWSNWERKPERREALRQLVVEYLEDKSQLRLTTSQLVNAILPGLNDLGKIYASNGLGYLRKHGLIDGYWTQGGKNPRTFGHGSIKWHSPDLSGTTGLEGVL